MADVKRAAHTNQVALMVVCRATDPQELQVSLELNVHSTFAVVKAKHRH